MMEFVFFVTESTRSFAAMRVLKASAIDVEGVIDTRPDVAAGRTPASARDLAR